MCVWYESYKWNKGKWSLSINYLGAILYDYLSLCIYLSYFRGFVEGIHIFFRTKAEKSNRTAHNYKNTYTIPTTKLFCRIWMSWKHTTELKKYLQKHLYHSYHRELKNTVKICRTKIKTCRTTMNWLQDSLMPRWKLRTGYATWPGYELRYGSHSMHVSHHARLSRAHVTL